MVLLAPECGLKTNMNSTRPRISLRSSRFLHHHFNGKNMELSTAIVTTTKTPPTTCTESAPDHEP